MPTTKRMLPDTELARLCGANRDDAGVDFMLYKLNRWLDEYYKRQGGTVPGQAWFSYELSQDETRRCVVLLGRAVADAIVAKLG